MSLSTILLPKSAKIDKGKGKDIDKGLDDIFRSNTYATPGAAIIPNSSSAPKNVVSNKDRKRGLSEVEGTSSGTTKRLKSKREAKESGSNDVQPMAKLRSANKSSRSEIPKHTPVEHPPPIHIPETEASGNKGKETVIDDGSGEDSELDGSHHSDDEGDPSKLVHESLVEGSRRTKSAGKTKYVPSDETPDQRNLRTIFVGNVPIEVGKNKRLVKQFTRHILSFVPDAKIESTRFRSVAFQSPTSKLPTLEDDGKSEGKPILTAPPKEKDARPHDRERTASWRAKTGDDEDVLADTRKTFLTPAEKKRVAFIKHELHSGVDAINAYVVFAHPVPAVERAANLPPLKPTMDPYEAAAAAMASADGSLFMERTIRVDLAGKGKIEAADVAGDDPKRTVFVGNLDFASKEEDVRTFFEGLMSAERGPPVPEEEEDEQDDEHLSKGPKPAAWVKRVRIIRDKDTQLGKGFAYVQFADRECVDEILNFDLDRLKFAKRKLRVQRCRSVPGGPKAKSFKPTPSASASAAARPPPPFKNHKSIPAVPKGDPFLGSKISHLPKDERKQAKAADADRVARRAAKKQAMKMKTKLAEKVGRERVRRKPGEKKSAPNAGGNTKKGGKVRTNRALAKLNTKK